MELKVCIVPRSHVRVCGVLEMYRYYGWFRGKPIYGFNHKSKRYNEPVDCHICFVRNKMRDNGNRILVLQ